MMSLVIDPTLPPAGDAREDRCLQLANIVDILGTDSIIDPDLLFTALRDNPDSSDEYFNYLFHKHRFFTKLDVYVIDYEHTPYSNATCVGKACCAADALEIVKVISNYRGRRYSSFTLNIPIDEYNWDTFGYHLVYGSGPQLVLEREETKKFLRPAINGTDII